MGMKKLQLPRLSKGKSTVLFNSPEAQGGWLWGQYK